MHNVFFNTICEFDKLLVSLYRAVVGGNSGPATAVDASLLVKDICVKLEAKYHSP